MKRLCFLFAVLMVLQTGCADKSSRQRTTESLPLLRAYPTSQIGATDPNHQVGAIDTVMHSGERLVVHAAPAFTEQQVIKSEEVTTPNAMGFWLDESGKKALRTYTRGAIQQRMAIRFGERWVGFPSVQSEIKNGWFAILDLTEEEKTAITTAFGSAAD